MRRKDKEMTSLQDLEKVLSKATICHLGISDGSTPYIVPLSFGYKNNTLYFHSAPEGRKIDLLRVNPRVSFQVETDVVVLRGTNGCNWTMAFRSIMGTGEACFLEDPQRKREALSIIANHYGSEQKDYRENAVNRTLVFIVAIQSMTGKCSVHNE